MVLILSPPTLPIPPRLVLVGTLRCVQGASPHRRELKEIASPKWHRVMRPSLAHLTPRLAFQANGRSGCRDGASCDAQRRESVATAVNTRDSAQPYSGLAVAGRRDPR